MGAGSCQRVDQNGGATAVASDLAQRFARGDESSRGNSGGGGDQQGRCRSRARRSAKPKPGEAACPVRSIGTNKGAITIMLPLR